MDIFKQLENEIKSLSLESRGDFLRNFLRIKRMLDERNTELLAEQRKLDLESKKKILRKLCPGGKAYYVGTNSKLLGAEMHMEKVNSKTVVAHINGESWRIPLESVSLYPDNPSRISAQRAINNYLNY